MTRIVPVVLLLIAIAILECFAIADDGVQAESIARVSGFLKEYCADCHKEQNASAGLSLQALKPDSMDPDLALWEEIVSRIESGNMPPKESKNQPNSAERKEVADVLRKLADAAHERVEEQRPSVLRRLNRREYANSIHDLLGVEWDPSLRLPVDDALFGFDNVAEGLQLSSILVENYVEIGREALERALRSDSAPEVRRWSYHLGHPSDFPKESTHFGIYNGNAHLSFGNKSVYIGGPALFSEVFPYPPNRFMYEGRYRMTVRMTPHNFPSEYVASFRFDGPNRLIEQRDFTVQNEKEIVFETSFYYDRADECLRTEMTWTNGHHLSWQVRDNPKKDPYYNYWWLIHYKEVDGKRIDWKPQIASELPFGYFDNVRMELSGPHFDDWPPESTTRWGSDLTKDDGCKDVLRRFLNRCFRREIDDQELLLFVDRYDQFRQQGVDPIEAYRNVFAIALASPEFLFLIPSPSSDPTSDFCDGFELASRLSYFLWSGPPDETLFELAKSGQLTKPEELSKQALRMLADPKANQLKTHFVRQWLRIDKLASVMPEPKLFPFYSEALRDAMRDESMMVMRDVIDNNLPIQDWIAGDWTYLNEKLADHYGITGIDGDSMRRVSPVPETRGGLYSHASILTMNSEATRTSPVLRGKWILDCLFHRSPPPPPPNVSSLQPDASLAKTPKEHLLIHKELAACSGCHSRIDPFGLVLENYDAIGQWRTQELPWEDPASQSSTNNGNAKKDPVQIDASSKLSDGTSLDGPLDLRKYLLAKKHDIAVGFTEQLMIYALGRGLRYADRQEVQRIVKSNALHDFRFHSILQGLVTSDSFRTRNGVTNRKKP